MNAEKMKCEICDKEVENLRFLVGHLRSAHKMKSEEYCLKYILKNNRPVCRLEGCENHTNYKDFNYRPFCKEHAEIAHVETGKTRKGQTAWCKGMTKETNASLASRTEKQMGSGNSFFGKKHSKETRDKIAAFRTMTEDEFVRRVQLRGDHFEMVSTYADYVSTQTYISVKCRKCGNICKRTLISLRKQTMCHDCYPCPRQHSKLEQELADFISDELGIGVSRGDRIILKPKELDIYIPSRNAAFEFNGLVWHSEKFKEDKEFHRNKTMVCKSKGIQLTHIFEDEWEFQREIVKSTIRRKLDKIENKIDANSCTLKEIGLETTKEFFENNHLLGDSTNITKTAFGLYRGNELVSCISLKIPRYKTRRNTVEIARFADKLNMEVIGSFPKFLQEVKCWSNEHRILEIIAHSDLHYDFGEVYKNNGFEYIKDTATNYWYTDFTCRYPRTNYKARNGLTESQVAKDAQVTRIFDCGSSLYRLSL